MTRWRRYWFAEGGRYAAAIVRIGIAAAVLLTLMRLATLSTVDLPGPRSLYRPVGIWMLFGHMVPPDAVITGLWVLAWAGTGAMLIGLRTRLATAVSFGAAVSLASLSFASSATWSHQYNVVFLAQLAFLGARGGDVLSVDALIRKLRALPAIDVPRGYQWSLRLVQLAVALMFSGAVFHKLLHGHFTLRWALSDNLRHQLLVRYDLAGIPRSAVVDWIIDDVWRYRTAALLNLVSQATPIAACIFINRPLVRLMGGMFFVVETIALGLVVSLWNLHWLPLVVVFVDWDRVLAWLGRPASPPATPEAWKPPRAARTFVLGFVVYDVITAFVPTLDQTLNTYPFSAFPMFANIRASAPYDEHQPYAVPGDHYEVTSDHALDPAQQRWFDHQNRRLYNVHEQSQVGKRLTAILATAKDRYPELGIHAVRHYLTIFEAPAYPEPAHFEPHPIAILGEVAEDHAFRSALGELDGTAITFKPIGLAVPDPHFIYYRDDRPTPIELRVHRDGDRYIAENLEGDPLYIAVMIDGKPWLVASHADWKWN